MTYTEADLKDLERVCHNLTHPKTSRKLDGEMGRKRLIEKFGQDTVSKMFAALKGAGRLG